MSMDPSILPGDILLISKMSYGTRLVKLNNQKKVGYFRTKGFSSIKKNDVFVFNWPNYEKFSETGFGIYGDYVVKRCFGLPGDSVNIKKAERSEDDGNGRYYGESPSLFPHDSTLTWTVDKYGPLYVPAKGDSMILTKRNVAWYKDILQFENPDCKIIDSFLITTLGDTITDYKFKHNYYFMLGDNFYHSEDSRYWGFVPDDNIIGKAVVVLFSIDKQGKGFKKIRWNRIMKLI
jgi:signal peptidase I